MIRTYYNAKIHKSVYMERGKSCPISQKGQKQQKCHAHYQPLTKPEQVDKNGVAKVAKPCVDEGFEAVLK